MQTPDEAASTLEAAADLVRMNGLSQGDYWPDAARGGDYVPGLPVCALGALGVALGCTKPRPLAMIVCGSLAANALQARISLAPTWTSVPSWNDSDETTPELVVDTFLACAKDLRNGEPR